MVELIVGPGVGALKTLVTCSVFGLSSCVTAFGYGPLTMVSEDGSRGNRGKGSQKGFGEKIAVLCGSCLVTWLFADDDSAEV